MRSRRFTSTGAPVGAGCDRDAFRRPVQSSRAGPARTVSLGRPFAHSILAGLVVVTSLLLTATAFAQTDGNDATPESAEVAEIARVEVVGSRIKRVDIETAQPVLVLERAQLERTGLMSVGDILQDLTVHGAALNSTVNNGGDGTTRVDLRNLGDQRTLVLVDGRRWIKGIDGAADMNSIPLAIVERIEVLKDGASAVYGSDAIAGVVNITTRRDFSGSEVRAHVGQSEYGDGRVQSYSATFGGVSERGAVSIGLSHVRQDEIFAGDRTISAVPTFGLPPNDVAAGASQTTENGLYGFGPVGLCPYNPAGNYPASGVCPSPDGRPRSQNRSTFDPASGGYRLFDPRNDGYNFAPDNYLVTPGEHSSVFVNADHALGERTRATLQALIDDRGSSQQLAPNPIMLGILLPPTNQLTIPAEHVYNPFGQPVTALFLRPGGQVRRFEQDADTLHVATGLEGEFDLAGRLWTWDADLIYSRYRIANASSGLPDLSRLRTALGPTYRDADGSARCGTPAAPIAGCVPFDPFRGPAGLTPEMIDYVYFAGEDRTRTDSRMASLALGGDLVDLPAGPLAFALGYEYRREQGSSELDPRRIAIQGLVDNSYGGEVTASEFFVEISAPLLVDAPGAQLLEANLAVRRSDYREFGLTTNADAGLRWQPVSDLMVRANYSQGFRAPIVSELYFPPIEGFGSLVADPCSVESQPSPEQRANCLADGVPGGVYEPAGVLFDVIGGGNPELQPETALSRGLGIVWSPAEWPGLDVALDWYRIRINDAITSVEADVLLNNCANAGVAAACARTFRNASGELLIVDARALNSGVLDTEGYDLSIGQQFDTGIGVFEVRWESTYIDRYDFEVPRGADLQSGVGLLNFFEPGFRVRSNLNLSWQRGAWSLAAGIRYYAELEEACLTAARAGRPDLCSDPDATSPLDGESPVNRLGSRTYVDLQAEWRTSHDGRVLVGVNNAFDRDPPVSYSSANSFDPAYPIPGRNWYLEYVQKF